MAEACAAKDVPPQTHTLKKPIPSVAGRSPACNLWRCFNLRMRKRSTSAAYKSLTESIPASDFLCPRFCLPPRLRRLERCSRGNSCKPLTKSVDSCPFRGHPPLEWRTSHKKSSSRKNERTTSIFDRGQSSDDKTKPTPRYYNGIMIWGAQDLFLIGTNEIELESALC